MTEKMSVGNVSEEWMQGNVRVRIFDGAYSEKTVGDVQKILDGLTNTCWKCIETVEPAAEEI